MKQSVLVAVMCSLSFACVDAVPLVVHAHDAELRLDRAALDADFVQEAELKVSPVLSLDDGANRVGLMSKLRDGASVPLVFVRGVDGDQRGPWSEVSWTFDELAHLAGFGELEDVYVAVQVGVSELDALEDLTFAGALTREDALEENTRRAPLSSTLANAGVISRAAWGARAPRCSRTDSGFDRIALHHGAARALDNVELQLRQTQAYHMDGRGYCDVAYHFAVAQDGRVFELRSLPFRGGHTRNHNARNVGVMFNGCFHSTCGDDRPTDALLNAGADIVRLVADTYGVEVNGDRVRGHREHAGAATACPGEHLFAQLDTIRERAQSPVEPEPTPPVPSGCGIAPPGTIFHVGDRLESCDGRTLAIYQSDGNFVLYEGSDALFHTSTFAESAGAVAMQTDGNLVVYSAWGAPLWSTGTHGHHGAYLQLTDSGNLELRRGDRLLWQSDTRASPPPPPVGCGRLTSSLGRGETLASCDGRFVLAHQNDGNVVLFQGASALWHTETYGQTTTSLIMQADGNLVLYGPSGALWHTHTYGHAGASFFVQDDGNLVIYHAGNAIWSR